MKKIAISATEPSADLIAGELIATLKKIDSAIHIFGLAGDQMAKAGCDVWWHLSEVSVMGFSEVFRKLPKLLHLKREMVTRFLAASPDVFISIDGPDFNLKIARKLKQKSIKTVHFVSPSVWAWRAWRIKKIKKSIDLLLCLFPFEPRFYEKSGVRALFVGHPLTHKIQPRLHYQNTSQVLLMPGSRTDEIRAMLPNMLKASVLMAEQQSTLSFHLALNNVCEKKWVKEQLAYFNLDINVTYGRSHHQLKMSDVAIIASGTATLEALMIGVPMVVVYKMSTLSYYIARGLIKIPFIALPNIIAGENLVSELIQKDASAKCIAQRTLDLVLKDNSALIARFNDIYHYLNCDTNQVVHAIQKVLDEK